MFFQRLIACYRIQVCGESRVISATSCNAGRHATETLHKVATTWQKETGKGAAKKHDEQIREREVRERGREREGSREGVEIMSSRPGPASARYKTSPTCRAMIAALHGLIAPANVPKGYADHEFVIGSLNDLSARSTCPKP